MRNLTLEVSSPHYLAHEVVWEESAYVLKILNYLLEYIYKV
jgi:hypothetical protein